MEKILVLDDDEAVLSALEDSLKSLNYSVRALSEAKNLFEHIEEFKPDLLLLDFMLDSENGGAICHQIKCNELLSKLPVIMMSGYCDVIDQAEKAGANDFIKKPFDLFELDEKISLNLNRRQSDALSAFC